MRPIANLFQHGSQPRRSAHRFRIAASVLAGCVEARETKSDRVFPRQLGEFIHETLDAPADPARTDSA